MKVKKKKEVNLEKRRGIYRAIGLLFALTIVLAAFEYRTLKHTNTLDGCVLIPLEEEQGIISIPNKPIIPPPPKNPIDLSFLIDNEGDEDPIEFSSLEIDENQPLFASTEISFVDEVIEELDPPVLISEVMPEFIGGIEAMYRFLHSNIKYPKRAIDTGTQGRVYLRFVVERDGSISNIEVLNHVEAGCTEEAIRVVKSMPQWKPGEHMGEKVRVKFILPVSFILN